MEEKDYSSPKYDDYRRLIKNFKNKGLSWSQIEYAKKENDRGLAAYLKTKVEDDDFPPIDIEDWKALVKRQKEEDEETEWISKSHGAAMILNADDDADFNIPDNPRSSWQLYKKKLLEEKKYSKRVVKEIEYSTLQLLRRLRLETPVTDPVKGLVVGNVQSGKTGNMAALMSMAADYGFNLFIILSGTIESLRVQTSERLMGDLNNEAGTLNWIMPDHISKKSPRGQRTQDYRFENSNARYVTVCLKNSSRLKDLIQWLQADPNKQKQMKILVIDDEADQASINTAADQKERTKINKCICDLVNGNTEKHKPSAEKFKAMNYIGYTATPYANVLNEREKESLYPKNFIATLSTPKEYFGPQQIFGNEKEDYDGLDIIRIISEDDLENIKDIHRGQMDLSNNQISSSLEQALCWFIDGVACQRYWGYVKPVSMLIHTSQKTDHHERVSEAIRHYFKSHTPEQIIDRCQKVWDQETKRFPLKKFEEQYQDYANSPVKDYPSFEEILPEVESLVKEELQYIRMDDDNDFQYSNGIHLCIDNCRNNGVTADGIHMRLTYPTHRNQYDKAPAFIVIGGATLSRGLTLEGLISSYFLRSVGQADTLMQMGRWFGYRRGYELLPRIWLTVKTVEQFKFLSDLDEELRDEILDMQERLVTPAQYGPKVKNTPSYRFIQITAKNKMKAAKTDVFDFSGAFFQTYRFYNDKKILRHNLELNTQFIDQLGPEEKTKPENQHFEKKNRKVWRNVPLSKVKEYLQNYDFGPNTNITNRIDSFIEWLEKNNKAGKLENWNVIFADGVTRSRKIEKTQQEKDAAKEVINIGTLRDPVDFLADADSTNAKFKENEEKIKSYEKYLARTTNMRLIRELAGLEATPQLIIYAIKKNSKARESSVSRADLNAVEDIIGICINVPGGTKGVDYGTKVSIPAEVNIFDDQGDLEEGAENGD